MRYFSRTSQAGFACFLVVFVSAAQAAVGEWSPTGPMGTGRSGPTATLLPNGKVLVAGGRLSDFSVCSFLNSAELYDPTTGTFSPTGPMGTGRSGPTATLLPNGKVLVAGGQGEWCEGPYLNSAELYDPVTGTFSPTGPMGTARVFHTATHLPNGKVLIAAGFTVNQGGGTWLRTAELYDPVAGTFSAATELMVIPRIWHSATLLDNGKVLIAGGWGGYDWSGYYLNSAELYDPATGTFSPTGTMGSWRAGPTATLLPNSKVLITGGFVGWSYPNPAELYDSATGTFSPTGPMVTARSSHTATLLPNGKVLVAGGQSNGSSLNSAELYDLTTETFSSTGTMGAERYGPTATLLPNGKVLVTGGSGNSAELYDSGTQCQNRLVCTSWDQKGDYTIKVDPFTPESTYWYTKGIPSGEWVVGCTAVAVGQLINYYFEKQGNGWLKDLLVNTWVQPKFDGKSTSIHLDGYTTEPRYDRSITNTDSDGAKNIRRFLMYTALGLESEFQLEQQFTGFPGEGGFLQVLNPLQKILYQRFRFNFSIREVSRSITRLDNEKERIIRSIDNGIPMILILADGRDNITNKHAENHAVLIDGYVNNGEGFWVKINWGLGNRGLLNDNLYPTDGQINVTYHDDKYNYDVNRTWGRFVLYFNVVPR